MIVQCDLCPKRCLIKPGQSGECRIRINAGGKLVASTYGRPCAAHVDPVEKKPLFHFLPGTGIFSIATVGCNLHCKNCQNWEISQENPENIRAHVLPPKKLVEAALKHRCRSVAYTYTDPVVYYEYALDSCIAAREAGLRNVLVTAGYINPEPARKLYAHVDAANVDIKAFSDDFYRTFCDASLVPVLEGLVIAKELGVHIEITNLVIPTLNDRDENFRDLSRWIVRNMEFGTPLHFSRFFPRYKMKNLPPTPADTLERARLIAKSEGLRHVYIGNVMSKDGENTFCANCGRLLIERRGYAIVKNDLVNGACPDCGYEARGVWK